MRVRGCSVLVKVHLKMRAFGSCEPLPSLNDGQRPRCSLPPHVRGRSVRRSVGYSTEQVRAEQVEPGRRHADQREPHRAAERSADEHHGFQSHFEERAIASDEKCEARAFEERALASDENASPLMQCFGKNPPKNACFS